MPELRAAIAGAAGYTGGELVRLLLLHPRARVVWAGSRSRAGEPVAAAHADLFGDTELRFSEGPPPDADVLFLALPHGRARDFLAANDVPPTMVVIDLSEDFRLSASNEAGGRRFVYGLPELRREAIRSADAIANPGCFATAMQLALLPLALEGLLPDEVLVNGSTGSTGAGVSPGATSHFSWRHANVAIYQPFTHRHLREVRESLAGAQPGSAARLLFVPQRGPFTRGIHLACTMRITAEQERVEAVYRDFCAAARFTRLSPDPVDLKQVVNTNKCLLHLHRDGDALLVTAVLDNLLKGAAGQAVQNMNLRFGFEEDAGLRLKASAY